MNMKFIPFSKIELSLYRNSVFLSSLLVNSHFSTFASINHALIHYWNQPSLSHEGEISCSRKPCAPLMGFELMACSSPLNHTVFVMCQVVTLFTDLFFHSYYQRHVYNLNAGLAFTP